jgi:predicted AlkP superfamily phosphohydrolase/phosphomutase
MATSKSPRVCVIGLDAADPGMLTRMMTSGSMPHLQSLKDRGTWGYLETPEGLGDDAVWASFSTGAGPQKHGRYFHRVPNPKTYGSSSFKEGDLGIEPFWSVLSREGRKVCIIDVPKTLLASGINGIQLSDWRVHGRDGATRSWPPELAQEIIRTFGDDDTDREPEYLCRLDRLPDGQYEQFVARLHKSVRQKLAVSLRLLVKEDWDLFTVVFKEAHCVGHQCWHLTNPAHPEYDEAQARQLDQPVEQIYAALDTAVGELLEELSDETTVIVFSTLGMNENVTGEHLLESVLLRLEPNRLFGWWQRIYDFARKLENPTIRRYAKGIHRRLMPHRTAYHVEHNELSGAIRLNLAQREANGKVHHSDHDRFLSSLEQEVMDLRDAATGSRVVDRVIRTDRAFPGEKSNVLADLLVEWNRDRNFTTVVSPSLGRLTVRRPAWRTGNHVAGGVFYATGPAVIRSSSAVRASVEDLPVSIAALLGTTLSDADGHTIESFSTIA